MCPKNASYYGNRAATLMMLGRFREALGDAQQSVRLDDSFVRGHLREGKCHLSLGNAMAACRSFQRALELDHKNAQAQQEFKNANAVMEYEKIAETDFEKRDFRKAGAQWPTANLHLPDSSDSSDSPVSATLGLQVVFCMDRALEFAPACHRFKILKAECLAMLGRYPEAQSVASDILRMDSTNADALYVRGLCLYYEDCIEKAVQFFVQALRMAPDHEKACIACRNAKALKAKKEDGNKAFKEGNYKLAYELYTEALGIDPNNIKTNAKLYCNRGTVNSKLRKLDDAIEDCTNAVKLDDTYIKAYLRRAQCYMDTEQYEEAVRDYEKVYQTEKTKEHKQLLKNAQLELKKSKRKDYYKILGVDKNASEDEIKKAYRKRALMHHPDRHSGASAEVQKEEEKKFKEVGEAFTILSDPKKKTRYDSGQDLDEEGMNMGDFDPNNIFKAFFGGPGGFSFEGRWACCCWEFPDHRPTHSLPLRHLFGSQRGHERGRLSSHLAWHLSVAKDEDRKAPLALGPLATASLQGQGASLTAYCRGFSTRAKVFRSCLRIIWSPAPSCTPKQPELFDTHRVSVCV
ncbi:dnaJ homolog subfamily C member 7 isoform X9 [Macaca fascicularis]